MRLVLTGWRVGARKIDATQAIRRHCDLGLADAKAAVDRCLDGECVELACPDRDAAHVLWGELEERGFRVQQQ